jgi:hypothetical protein
VRPENQELTRKQEHGKFTNVLFWLILVWRNTLELLWPVRSSPLGSRTGKSRIGLQYFPKNILGCRRRAKRGKAADDSRSKTTVAKPDHFYLLSNQVAWFVEKCVLVYSTIHSVQD